MLLNRKMSEDDFAFTCILKYIQGQHMAGKPFPANRRQGSPRISRFHEMRYERYCNECQHTRRLSPLRRASGEHPSALKRMPVRRRDTLRSLSPHIGIASLDDKGAPYGYCTDESAWAYRVPDAYAPNMPVSGVPWATEVESSPHPGSGECAEDFNNSLTSKETAMKTVISTSKAPAAIGPVKATPCIFPARSVWSRPRVNSFPMM